MIIGIDMGGTHSDGVLINDSTIKTHLKTITLEENISGTIISLIENLIKDQNKKDIKRIVLSTTIITNLLSKNMEEKTGLFFIPGLGAPTQFITDHIKDSYFAKTGYVDHRGVVIKKLNPIELEEAVWFFKNNNIK